MKKSKISIIVSILILIGFFLFRVRPIKFNQKVELAILEQIETDFLWRTLRYIPESVSERFDFALFKEKEKEKIYCVNYSYKSVFYSFYYLIDANGDVENIKKGFISSTLNKFDLTNLIEKKTFNKVARHFNWSDQTSRRNFSFFLSNLCDKEYSSPLENIGDYEYIIELYPLSNDKEILLSPLLPKEKVEYLLSKKDTSIYYYWYYDQGLIKFSYHMNDGEIESVQSSYVGYLGNEVIQI